MFNPNYKLVICLMLGVQGYCFPVENNTHIVYDQKQSGKFNIHINIKDVAIIDVNSNEFIDDTINDADEYYYDEDDLTVKPLLPWPPSTSDAAINYSPNYTLPEKEEMHQLNVTGNETNPLNYANFIQQTTVPSKEHQNESKDSNIPRPYLREAQENTRLNKNIVIPTIQRKWKSNLNFIDLLFGQTLNKSTGCNGKYGYSNNRNCRKTKHSISIKSLLGLMQSMKIKDN